MEHYASDRSYRVKQLGAAGAKKLETRLDDLQAAFCLEDLRNAAGKLHELKGNRKHQFSMTITGAKRLIIFSTKDPPPKKPDGGLDWSAIKEITLLEIKDYH